MGNLTQLNSRITFHEIIRKELQRFVLTLGPLH